MKLLKISVFITILSIALVVFGSETSSIVNASEDAEIKNVLIINSYHEGFTWTRELTKGIIETLNDSGNNISIQVEYMDWKNNPTKENLEYLYDYYEFKYQNKSLDIIITTDDIALEFALEHRKEIFHNAPIVFAGVNQSGMEDIVCGYTKITGVIEVIDPNPTLELALTINPELKNVYLIFDNSESGLSTGNIAINHIKSRYKELNIIPCNHMTYEELINTVQGLEEDSMVLITTYYSDVNNQRFEMDFVNRDVSENSRVPTYQIYDFGLNNGILGGVMISGRLQGELAGGLALQILQGAEIDNIPIITKLITRTVIDYEQLERFEIDEDILPKNVEIINRPFSFYETYKTLVISVTSAFFALIVFVGILLFYIKKIRKMKEELRESHEELTQIYEELAASDEEIREQYDQMKTINKKLKEGEEKLAFLAFHDSLTGLPNKLSLYEDTKAILLPGKGMSALLFIDIDNFKNVNDVMGHAFGDKIIIKVGERLSQALKNGQTLYRLSGDEFIIIIENLKEPAEAEQFASHILNLFSEELEVLGTSMQINISIGIAIYPNHGFDLESLLKCADIAMYYVKDIGKKNYILYQDHMNQAFIERVNIEKYLRKALDHNEIEIYYQPQLDIQKNQIIGFEALLRWNSPQLGSVPPIKFIKVAEETHCIIPLGTWVLKNACKFIYDLREQGYGNYSVSVNISILQLLQKDFCDIISDILNMYQLEAHDLELEITESILMESFERIESNLKKLRDMKVRIALDDFGKGYSSLNYLKQLPITTLKIDKSFIDIVTSYQKNYLAEHIITIGKSMGMCVVAEGVEKQEQLEYLKIHECDRMQGYLFSRPIPKDEILKLL